MKEGKYIYCIIGQGDRKTFGRLGIGGRGDELYTVCHDDISAVVSDSPIKKYPISRENLIPHERAIEEVMETHTVLPVRFATIAEDEEKVRKILEREHDKFVDLLKNMEGKKELSLKAVFKEGFIFEHILKKYEDIRALKDKITAQPPGKTYYKRTEIGRMVESALEIEKEIFRKEISDSLTPLAIDVKVNNTYGDQMIVNAAFLVEENREPEFDQKVEELVERHRDSVRFKYVGKLPPFNFVNLVIELGN